MEEEFKKKKGSLCAESVRETVIKVFVVKSVERRIIIEHKTNFFIFFYYKITLRSIFKLKNFHKLLWK